MEIKTEVYRGDVAMVMDGENIEGITREERNANANLIAAAPDLLEALELGLKIQKPGDIWSVDPAVVRGFLNAAHAAIAKAKGENQ